MELMSNQHLDHLDTHTDDQKARVYRQHYFWRRHKSLQTMCAHHSKSNDCGKWLSWVLCNARDYVRLEDARWHGACTSRNCETGSCNALHTPLCCTIFAFLYIPPLDMQFLDQIRCLVSMRLSFAFLLNRLFRSF